MELNVAKQQITGQPVLLRDMVGALRNAIEQKQAVTFFYKDNIRVVLPHALGEAIPGDYKLRAFQLWPLAEDVGDSQWRLFDVIKMSAPVFDKPSPGYKQGDKTMKAGILAELKV